MELARVVGSVIATAKTSGLEGRTLLVVVPIAVQDRPGGAGYVAVDRVGAGTGEVVLVTRGSAARLATRVEAELDAVIVAIVDRVDVPGMSIGGEH